MFMLNKLFESESESESITILPKIFCCFISFFISSTHM